MITEKSSYTNYFPLFFMHPSENNLAELLLRKLYFISLQKDGERPDQNIPERPCLSPVRLKHFNNKRLEEHLLTRSEEHTSELHHVAISYAVFCLKKKK